MGGLAKICKIYGSMKFKDKSGKEVIWLYDYVNDRPRLESEMTKEEIRVSKEKRNQQLKELEDETKTN